MKVIIVGAGLGGLGCAIACKRQGFEVVVFESAPKFLRMGDSIGFGSNSARLLYRWGIGEQMERIASAATGIKIYDFSDSEKCLGVDEQNSTAAQKYGCRSLIGHRGDFHLIMYRFALDLGITIHMGCTVTGYDTQVPCVTLLDGEKVNGDVIIIAEGVKSIGREVVLGYADMPLHSGYAIYRAFGDGDLFRDDPLTSKFLQGGDAIRLFLGPDKHGFVTTLRGGKEVNAVLTHKDIANIDEGWSQPAKHDEVLSNLDGWDPAFKRVFEKMPHIIDWKLVFRPCLDKWVADTGLVALMGDAAHPFLPTSTQGASQAIEDGATIAECLARCEGNVPLALGTYFQIRHDYVKDAQMSGIKQREKWHRLHDQGNEAFRKSFDINAVAMSNHHLWANDAEKVVDEQWEEVSKQVLSRL